MKKILILSFLFVVTVMSHSQIYVDNQGNVQDQRKTNKTYERIKKQPKQSTSKFDKSKLSIGGGIGLQFGDYTTINISPQVGYDFSKYLTAGAGFGYTYFKDSHAQYDWKSSYLSFNLFGRFYPIQNIVIAVQPEISRMWQTIEYAGRSNKENKFVPSLLLGGGLRFQGVIAMIQYDVLQDENTPYGDNIFYTVGYTFNF